MELQDEESHFKTLFQFRVSQTAESTDKFINHGSYVRICKMISAAYFKASGLLHYDGNAEENNETLSQNR